MKFESSYDLQPHCTIITYEDPVGVHLIQGYSTAEMASHNFGAKAISACQHIVKGQIFVVDLVCNKFILANLIYEVCGLLDIDLLRRHH